MPETSNQYDIIVVGAGLGAMTAAAIHSKRGKKVLVVEKHKVLGGYASVFGRKGTTFDVSLHLLSGAHGTRTQEILAQAGVYDKLEFIKPDALCNLQLEPNGPVLTIPNGDMGAFENTLLEMYPTETRAIKLWFWLMRRYGRQIRYFDNARSAPLKQGVTLFFAPFLSPLMVLNAVWVPILAKALRTTNADLRKILLHFSPYYGSPASEINMLFPMAANYIYYTHGGYYLKGGGFAITRQLSLVIRKCGGKIITGQSVTTIEVDAGRVKGIRTDKGEHFTANEIICGANPFAVYGDMLRGNTTAAAKLKRLNEMQPGMTASVLYIQLDTEIENLNPDLKGVYEFIQPPVADEETFYQDFRERAGFEGGYDQNGIVITIHSNADPDGHGQNPGSVLDIFYPDNYDRWAALSASDYKTQKKIEIEKKLDALEAYIPNIRDHISILELATPLTMEKFTGNKKGALYGFTQSPQQSLFKRQWTRGGIKGLSFVSAWGNPGGGYEGVLRCADNQANPFTWKGIGVMAGLIAATVLVSLVILN